jgi:hypothetical protein
LFPRVCCSSKTSQQSCMVQEPKRP